MATATANLTDLTEQTFSGHPHKVDREAGIISGVKVLGRVSKNGREYSASAMAKACKFYEGIEVNIDHPDRRNPGRERGVAESFGVLKNAAVRDDGVWADLHYVRSHTLAEQIAERAERFPDKLGLSHNAQGRTANRNGKTIVEDIDNVRSVDIVTRPATNAGLFESEEPGDSEHMTKTTYGKLVRSLPESTEKNWLLEMEGDMAPADMEIADVPAEASGDDQVKAAFRAAITAAFDDDKLDMKATLSRIKEILAAHDKLMNGGKKEAPPAEKKEGDDAMESLKADLAKLKAREGARDILESEGIEVTRLNVNAYLGQETDADRKTFIESLKVAPKVGGHRPASSPPKRQELTESVPAFKTPKDLAGFLRG